MSTWPSAKLVYGIAWPAEIEPRGWDSYDESDFDDTFHDRMTKIVKDLRLERLLDVEIHGHLDRAKGYLVSSRGTGVEVSAGKVKLIGTDSLPPLPFTAFHAVERLINHLGPDRHRYHGWLLVADYI